MPLYDDVFLEFDCASRIKHLGIEAYRRHWSRQFTLKVMVNHSTYGCVRPYVFSCFNHVDNCIDWQDNTKQTNWSPMELIKDNVKK